MGTIADKLTYLNGTKTAIKDAIVAKGVTVADSDTFRSYATKISEIPTGEPIDKKKYGISIDNVFGNVDENGTYVPPTEPFTPDFSNVKNLPGYALYYKFYNNKGVTGDVVFGFENISGSYAMQNAFYGTNIMSISFPQLTEISSDHAMSYAFGSCTSLTSVSFPALATISGYATMNNAFDGCTNLTSVSFPALTTVATNAFGPSYGYTFAYCTALTEIHFRADAQATIEAMTGYTDKWGATNATIYFDL